MSLIRSFYSNQDCTEVDRIFRRFPYLFVYHRGHDHSTEHVLVGQSDVTTLKGVTQSHASSGFPRSVCSMFLIRTGTTPGKAMLWFPSKACATALTATSVTIICMT